MTFDRDEIPRRILRRCSRPIRKVWARYVGGAPTWLAQRAVMAHRPSAGRYWQIGPQEFYKVPATWLKNENELLVFEEDDGQPLNGTLVHAEKR